MKKLYFFAFVAASLLMTSCVVGLGDESNQTEITVRHFADLTAELEDDSSVYIENGKSLCWHKGDLLSAFYGITQNCQYKFNGKTGDNSGIFSVVPSNELATGNPLNAIYALYPYNAKAKISKEGIISCTLPSVQSYAENSLGRDANTMVAVTENTDDTFLKFKNVCGYLKIKLYGNAVIENVVLRGNNDEKIAGAATISTTYGGVPTITMSSEATTAVTLDCSEGVMLGKTADEATELWFVVPATTFEKGITVVVTDNKGSVSTISTSKCITIERNTIQPMEAMEFAGSLTLSQEQMSVSAEGGKYSVDIYTEYAYQASANVDWIEIEDGGCSAEYYTQYFTVKPNDTTSSREGVITICCDDYNLLATLTIVQEQLDVYGVVIENVNYIGQFDTADKHLYTVEQKVSGDLVKYDNKGVEISREAFSKDLNLEVTFNGLEDVVYIENSVEYGKVSLTASSLDGDKINNRESDEFIIKSRSMDYHFKFDGGEKITVSTLYDRLIFDDDEVFAYSSIDRVRYNSYEAKLNEAQTNEDYISYDIILYFNVYLNQKNPDGTVTENTYSVAVPYTRSYKRLETYTVVENIGYIGQFDTADKHLYTVEQKVSGDLVKYDNKGVEISREAFSKDLNLEVTFDGPEDVIYVENSLELVEVSLTASSHDGDKINNRESDEFTIKSRSMDYHFKFDEGEKITVSTLYDRLIYNDEVFAHSAIDKVTYNSYEAQLNEAQTNEDYITYDIILYFNVKLNQKNPDGTVTENTYSVAVPYTRVFKHIKN